MSKALPISDVLAAVVRNLGLSRKLSEHRAVVDWEDIVGARVAEHARALRVDSGLLFVGVDSSVWAQELTLMKQRILRELRSRVGEGVINDVHFVLGGARPYGASGIGGTEAEDHGKTHG
ncbi:MAG: DUF721 domain-containing protein [Candidatus Eisenbacteria bacterium]|nr:DUF721 domain-containing protein [Candidatus Eisenbacteria bacterium]